MPTPPKIPPAESRAPVSARPHPEEELQASLDQHAPGNDIVAVVADCMRNASTYVRGGTEVPDYRVRLQAAQLLLAYRNGRPIERQEVRTQNIPTNEAMMEVLANSGEARRAYRTFIDMAEAKAEAVDVPK